MDDGGNNQTTHYPYWGKDQPYPEGEE